MSIAICTNFCKARAALFMADITCEARVALATPSLGVACAMAGAEPALTTDLSS